MASDKRYSRTIELNGVADFSNIVNAVKKLRSEVEGKANSADLLNVDRTITKIQELQIKIQEAQKKGFSSQKETNDFNKMIEQLLKSAGDLQAKFQNIHIKGLDNELNNAVKALKDAEAEYRRIGKEQTAVIKEQFKGIKGNENFAKQIIDAATNTEQLKQTEEAINKVLEDRKKIQENNQNIAKGNLDVANNNLAKAQDKRYSMGGMRTSSFTKTGGAAINTEDLARIKNLYQTAIDGSNKAETAIKKFKDALDENGYAVKNNATLQRNLEKAYGDLKVEVDSAVAAQKSAQSAYNAATEKVNKADNEIKTFQSTLKSSETASSIEKINAAFNTMGQKVNDVAAAEQKLKNSPAPKGMEELKAATEDSTRAFQQNRQELEQSVQAQLQLDSVSDFLGNTVKRVLSLTSAWQGFKRIVRSTFEDIKNLDKAFGSIAMVTDMTVGDLWQQYGTYAEMANRLGQTTQGVIEASSLYYQQGLETVEVMSLTEETMKLATLAGLDFKEATSQMTAAIRAFKLEMSDGAHVTDVYAELAANAAADVQGISEAMSATAAIAHSAGMEFETTSAMLTTMIEATQEAPKNLGTAMKTIIARFTELKENVAGTTDSEFDDLDYNKVDKALKSVGVSLKDATGQFRDLDDVFLELSAKWDTLDRNSQRYIATIAAGSRQQSRFIALMENYDRTMELVNTAYDSAGKSSEQFAKYQDTVEYKLNKLKNAWEQTKTTLLSSDVYKDAIDFVTKLVTKLEGLDFKKLLIVGPVALIAGRQMAKNWVQGFSQGANTVKGVIEKVLSRINKNYKTTIQVEANVKEAETKLEQLKQKKAELNNQQGLLLIKPEVIQQLERAYQELLEIENVEGEGAALDVTRREAAKQKLEQLIQKYKEYGSEAWYEEKKVGEQIEQTNNELSEQKNLLTDKKLLSGVGQAAGAALGTAITMGMTGTFNVEEITKMITAQSAVSAISSLVSGNWQAALGQALVGGGSYLYGQWKTYVDSIEAHADVLGNLEKRIDSLKEKQNDLNAALGEATSKFEEQKTRYDTLSDAGETYEKLSQKIILSEEEQEKLNSATSTLLELEPQLLSYYNEAGQAILNMGDNWDTLMNKEKEYYNQLWIDQEKAQVKSLQNDIELAQAEYTEKRQQQNYTTKYITEASQTDLGELSQYDIQGRAQVGDYRALLAAMYNKEGTYNQGELLRGQIAKFMTSRVGIDFDIEDALMRAMRNDQSFGQFMTFLYESYSGEKISITALMEELKDNTGLYEKLSTEMHKYAENPDLIAQYYQQDIIEAEKALDELDIDKKSIILNDIKRQIETSDYKYTDKDINFIVSAFSQDDDFLNKIWEQVMNPENDYTVEDISDIIKDTSMSTFIEDYLSLTDLEKEQVQEAIEKIQEQSVNEYWSSDLISSSLNLKSVSIQNYLAKLENEVYKERKKIISDIGIDINAESDSKLGQALAQASLPNLTAFRDSLDGYSNEQKKIYLDGLEDFYEKTFADINSPELLNNLVSIKWDDIDILNIKENKKQFTDYAATLGVGTKQAEDIWDSYVDYLTNLGILDLSINAIGLEDYIKEADEKLSTLISKSSTIVEAIQGQIRNGFMSFSETEGLEETLTDLGMDAAKYINYGLDGNITLNTDKLKEDLLTQDDYENEIVNTMREQVNQQIAELENQKAILQGIIDSGKLEGERVTITAQIAENYEAAASALAFMTGGTYESKHKIITISDFDINEATKAMGSIDKQIVDLETKRDNISLDNPEIQALISKRNAAYQQLYQDIIKGEYDVANALSDVDQAQADYNEKLKARNKAEQDYYDKLEDRNKKLKAYTETLYGTELHKNKLDPLSNYSTMLDDITYKANKAKNALDDLEPGDNVSDLLLTYTTELHNEVVVRGAENQVIEQAMANAEANLAAYSDYWYKIGEEYYIDYDKLNAAAIPDDLSDEIENQIDQLRKYRKQIQDNDDAVEKLRKDFIDSQKKALQSYVNLEKEVVSTLKEKYQEEIDNLKDKYEAMEDADNEYLDSLQDAIDKERKLREKERDWDDLAQKEKKLSLMQRDTSGTNQLEVQKLEQEVQDDREQLLDSAIDDVINGLKELYELQQENRDSEIEYRESLLTEASLIQEANSIIASWQSSADAVNWFMSAKDLNAMSAAELEQEKQTWTDLYEAKVLYQEMSQQDFEEFLKASQKEMDKTMNTLTETATAESKRSLDEIKEKILETQQTAYNAWQDAIQNLSDAQEAWDKAEQAAQASYNYWTKLDASVQAAAEERERQKQERIANGTARNDDFDTLQEAKTYFDEHPQNRDGYYKNEQGRWVKNATVISAQTGINPDMRPGNTSPQPQSTGPVTRLQKLLEDNQNGKAYGVLVQPNNLQRFSDSSVNAELVSSYANYYNRATIASLIRENEDIPENTPIYMNVDRNGNFVYTTNEKPVFGLPSNLFNYKWQAYASGGLVNYTGPAWVDGSPSRPEAFLSADDTEMIGSLVDLLQELTFTNRFFNNMQMSTVGDTTIELTVNFDSVSEDYDADRVIELMQQKIVEAANYTGSNVILHKR